MKRFYLYIFLLFSYTSWAQDATESEISLEEKFMEANTHILLDRYDEALPLLKQIYKEDRNNAGLNYELARVHGSLGDLESAIKHAEKAAKIDPDNEYYQLLLGNMLMENGQNQEATEAFSKMIALQPEVTRYYDMLAKAYMTMGENNKALSTFDQLEQVVGFSEDLALRKVDILTEMNKDDDAAKVMERLVSTYPDEMRFRYNLGSFYHSRGKKEKARKVYEAILEIDPSDATANLAMLDNPDQPADDANYLSALQPLIENENLPLDKKILEMVPYLERIPNEPELVEPLLRIGKTLVQLHPEEAKVRSLYADIFNGAGNTKKAIEQYEKTLALNDRVYTVWEQLLLAYDKEAQYNKMSAKAEEAMDLFPNKASAYYLYASAQNSLGKHDEALSYLNDAFMISGKDLYHKTKVENQRARAYIAKKDYKKANKHLNNSTEWSLGQDAEAVHLMGDLYAAQGDQSKAQSYWDKAAKLRGETMSKQEKFMRGQ